MKILIADDHALFRDNLSTEIEKISPESIILQASNFSQSLKILEEQTDINLFIIDFDMTGLKWEENLQRLKDTATDTEIVIISASEDIKQIKKIISNGIKGYIPKRYDKSALQNALKEILNNKRYIPVALLDSSTEKFSSTAQSPIKMLTNRQSQVLDLIAQGKSNKQIAYEMGVSEATVKLHINALLRSLKVTNRTQAVITAQKMGLI